MKNLASLALILLAGCGDNLTGGTAAPDAPPTADAAPDAIAEFVPPAFTPLALSAGGTDQLLGATPGPNGSFYAVGFRAASFEATSDRELVLVKLTTQGALDTTFGGGDGIASLNVQTGGSGELWRGIATQSDGKIVVLGTVEDEVNAVDRDAAVVRFNADGTLDTTFGVTGVDNGIVRLDLNQADINGATVKGVDTPWGLAVDASSRLYIHAAQRNAGVGRLDTDFAVVRLTAGGLADATFAATGGTPGKFTLDVQNTDAAGSCQDCVRGIYVLADGTILAAGYANSTGVGSVQPVLYKLTSAGALDTSFGTGGVFHEVLMQGFTEVYGVALVSGKLVTASYGRNTATGNNDWVSARFNANGTLDTTWGTAGKVVFDGSMGDNPDNNRNVVALPGGRVALLGSTGSPATSSDAVFAILGGNGAFDTAFGTGVVKHDLGGAEQLWGGAVASTGNAALFVGYKGAGATPTATSNDNAYIVVLPLP